MTHRNFGYWSRRNRRSSSLVFSVFLIVVGIVLFLANLNWLPLTVSQIWQLWPLVFVVMGLNQIARMRRPSSIVIGGAFIALGVLYTLVDLGIFHVRIHDDSWPLSVLFLALGLGGLARVLDRGAPRVPSSDFAGEPFAGFEAKPDPWGRDESPEMGPMLENYTVMGSIKRKVESQNFQGGKLTSILGNIEIDLRRANMPQGRRSAGIEVHVYMGGIKLRVPETWRVVLKGDNVMGNVEDRTFPPVTSPDAPQLIITGSIVMGSIEIES
jgi:hypothetical protein